jgi:hypothetical protein
MAKERLSFRQRDLTAALKAARSAGVRVRKIVVRKDSIVIVPGEPMAAPVIEREDDIDPETAAALKAVDDAKI